MANANKKNRSQTSGKKPLDGQGAPLSAKGGRMANVMSVFGRSRDTGYVQKLRSAMSGGERTTVANHPVMNCPSPES
jgi:hypothetical protein